MNLTDKIKQVNPFDKLRAKHKIKPLENDLIIVIIIILVTFIAFGLYKLAELRGNKTPITIENVNDISKSDFDANAGGGKLYVASKNGAKYYYPWCSGVSRIKEENKVWFSSADEAKKAGFEPAANCKGL